MIEKNSADLVNPPENVSSRAYVGNIDEYRKLYQKSIDEPDAFWGEVAENFHWFEKWNQVRSFNYNMKEGPVRIEWFSGAKTNVCYNCVDRHLELRPNKTAAFSLLQLMHQRLPVVHQPRSAIHAAALRLQTVLYQHERFPHRQRTTASAFARRPILIRPQLV